MAYGEMSPGEHKFSLLGARPRVVDCHSKQATCGLVFFVIHVIACVLTA